MFQVVYTSHRHPQTLAVYAGTLLVEYRLNQTHFFPEANRSFIRGYNQVVLYCIALNPWVAASRSECSHISVATPLPRAFSPTMYPQLHTWAPKAGWFGLM